MQTTHNASAGLVDEFAIADFLKLSVHTVRQDRCHKRRIPFLKIGRTIRYSPPAVQAALAAYEMGGPSVAQATATRGKRAA